MTKAIIFGHDGVLVKTEHTMLGLLLDMAKQYGAEMAIDKALARFTKEN